MKMIVGCFALLAALAALPGCIENRQRIEVLDPGRPQVCASQNGAPYILPYPVGQTYLCSQGFSGNRGHTDLFRFAVDFDMPIGTLVTAARAGRVDFVEGRFGDDSRDIRETNVVVVRHEDGTYARYCHLTRGGPRVVVGQWVSAGDAIGLSGMSGSGIPLPHLHFDVTTGCSEISCQTIPFCFRNTIPHPYGPEPGVRYPAEPYS